MSPAGDGAPPRIARDPDLPLSYAQRRLWFLSRLEPDQPIYNVAAAWTLRGRLDAGALGRALDDVVRRHESLRTVFVERSGEPRQRVLPELTVPLARDGGPPARGDEGPADLQRRLRDEARRPFDLVRGPLVRPLLIETADEEHVLLLALHHIVCDNWSVHLTLRDLMAFYAGHAGGRPAALPEPAVQYADYAVRQQDPRRGGEMDEELDYWRQALRGAPGLLTLPSDRPRPAARTYRGATHRFVLPPALARALEALGRGERATPFMTLLAGFAALLSRTGGDREVVLGTPVAGRTRSEWEEAVGCFANTLPLRIAPGAAPSFRALLRRVREVCVGAYAHQELPFERLVEALAPPRSLGHEPLVQVMFQLLNAPKAAPRLADIDVAPLAIDTGTSKFDLTLFLRDDPSGLLGEAEFSVDVFEPATVARLMERFALLLRGAAERPDASLADLPLLDEAESLRVLRDWNATRVPRGGALLHDLVAARTARSPETIAVAGEAGRLTYGRLAARAGALARRLRDLGAGPDATVGICMERSPELLTALLGALESGAAYLPLDPESPQERLAGMIDDAAPCVLLTHAPAAGRLPPRAGTPVLRVDTAEIADAEPGPPHRTPLSPDHLAYVLFTSGSTGRPKGVMISHRAIGNRLLWMQEALGLTPDDRVLQKTSFGFDVSVWELFWPLIAGATVVMARPGGQRDPAYLARLIEHERITVLHFVPSMLAAFLEEPGIEASCATVRHVVCSGEALPPAARDRLLGLLPRARLHNLYGPTEASIDATWWECWRGREEAVVPIGRPIANMTAYVLDGRLRPLPPGCEGELFLGGAGLARGYAGRPDLTAARFLPDPFGGGAGERLYRTGDRARWRADGVLEFLGRRDGQVKLRGYRVEVGEIEAALCDQPAVRDAAVVPLAVAGGDGRLVAYVVPRHGALDQAALAAALRERLPDYMIPSSWVRLERLPLSPSGKLDRRALPPPDPPAAAAATEPPRTPTEIALGLIWAEVLRLPAVGRDADFFALGGHSLLAVQIVSRARTALGVELPLRAIFETPGLSALALTIDRLRSTGVAPARASIRPRARAARPVPPPAPIRDGR